MGNIHARPERIVTSSMNVARFNTRIPPLQQECRLEDQELWMFFGD
jgi:hypothetical protein